MEVIYKKDGIQVGEEFILLNTIIKNCHEIKIKEEKLVILEMEWDGRGGNVCERRIFPLKTALRIQEMLLGKEVNFGEIWGKHSEVYGTICKDTFAIEKDKKKIKAFLNSYPKWS